MRRRLGIPALLLVAACGTTVPAGRLPAASGPGPAGGALAVGSQDEPGGAAAAGSRAAAPGIPAGAPGPAQAGVPGTAPGTSAVGTRAAGGGLTATYPGVTADKIYVGVSAAGSTGSSEGQQVGQAFGVAGFSSAPERPLISAMIKDVNDRGGVLGRRLVPVYHLYDPADTRPYSEQSQEACATYTEDHTVFAHLAVVSDPSFFACMEARRTVGVERYTVGSDARTRGYPGIFPVSDLDYTTTSTLLVDSLVAQGFLTRASVIGLVQTDTTDFDRVRVQGIEAPLAKAGLKLATTYKVTAVNQASDEALAVRDAQSAVLQFASLGVDRVLFLTPNGALFDIAFMKQADQQGYRPRYGLSSHDAPVALVGGNAPPAQLAGSRGIGFSLYDDFLNVPSKETSPAVRDCLETFRREGVAAPTDRGQLNQYLTYCATFRLFTTIAAAAGPDLTRAGFIAAGEELAGHYDDPFAIDGLSWRGPGEHGGITAYQPIAYGSSCDCYSPAGPVATRR